MPSASRKAAAPPVTARSTMFPRPPLPEFRHEFQNRANNPKATTRCSRHTSLTRRPRHAAPARRLSSEGGFAPMHDDNVAPSSAGKKKNKMPRADRPGADSREDDAGMRVSVTWERVNPDARAPMSDIDNVNLPAVTPASPAKLPPLRDAPAPPPPVAVAASVARASAMDLDETPVTGAPDKDFETLLREQLAKEERGGVGGGSKHAKTPPGATPRSASARKFLRKGARMERTTPPAAKHGSAAAKHGSKPRAALGSKATSKPSRRTGTSSYAFDDSEPVDVETEPAPAERGDASDGHPMSREENEAAELAEFEALERELAVDPGPARATSSFVPAAQKAAGGKKSAVRVAAARASTSAGGFKKVSAASTPPDDDDDASDESDGFAVEDHFGGASRRTAGSARTAASAPPVAFDDDEEFSDDEETAIPIGESSYANYPEDDHFRRADDDDRVKPRTSKTDHAAAASDALASSKPGDGAPALIQSLFYGNERRPGSRVGSRVTTHTTDAANAGKKTAPAKSRDAEGAMAKAEAAMADATEAKAAADDAAARVRRERDRLERDKSSFAQEKRAAARERQTWEKQRADANAAMAQEREEIKADAERLRRDRQRLERDSKRVLSALPTKKERTEIEDLREKLARAREDQRAKDTKQRHTVDRLRAQIVDLQTEVAELKGEKRRLEQQILDGGKEAKYGQVEEEEEEEEEEAEFERKRRELREREAEEEERAERRREREQKMREDRERELELDRERELRERRKAEKAEKEKAETEARRAEKAAAAAASASAGGVTAAEAAAACGLPSVHDPAPRVGPPPSSDHHRGGADEIAHDDGRVERVLPGGRRVVRFANGTLKDISPSAGGPISTVYFTNGDVKRTHPGGRVEYFYREVDTWHTTHPGGIEVYHFPSGQTEAHGPDGYKEILFPDGLLRKVHADGREEDEVLN